MSSHASQAHRFSRATFAQDVQQAFRRRLYSTAQIEAPSGLLEETPGNREALRDASRWVQDFIIRPHPAMNRPGAVCPYVELAIAEDLLYFSVGTLKPSNRQQALFEELRLYKDIFVSMPPFEGELSELRAFTVLFPGVDLDTFYRDSGMLRLKAELMQAGVMLGQFGPYDDPQKHLKDKFFPVECTVPLYVFRTFLEGDWRFIQEEKLWREVYRQYFGKTP